jgi:hypothetical protein
MTAREVRVWCRKVLREDFQERINEFQLSNLLDRGRSPCEIGLK